jgi:hypothetical protein
MSGGKTFLRIFLKLLGNKKFVMLPLRSLLKEGRTE